MESTGADIFRQRLTEGSAEQIAKRIQPSLTGVRPGSYLSLALAGIAFSGAVATFAKRRTIRSFFGLWVPTMMLASLYRQVSEAEGVKAEDHKTSQNLYH